MIFKHACESFLADDLPLNKPREIKHLRIDALRNLKHRNRFFAKYLAFLSFDFDIFTWTIWRFFLEILDIFQVEDQILVNL
jgi:hypothetical protein